MALITKDVQKQYDATAYVRAIINQQDDAVDHFLVFNDAKNDDGSIRKFICVIRFNPTGEEVYREIIDRRGATVIGVPNAFKNRLIYSPANKTTNFQFELSG